ncbi:unnamed protein product [Allacma fusca]|uniref:Uridine 5'-monophosphate synthase n=1 Tax=Allacma fusca TaxID=39272 RepID=A0A8J2PJY8_9HEXA|nr:unnamed protein product [Allacma fusca]
MPSTVTMDLQKVKALAVNMFKCGAVKFGSFQLKSGIYSPIYFDLRVIISKPDIMNQISDYIWAEMESRYSFDSICGVPYTALPIATLVSANRSVPMILRRKEAKMYGTGKLVEGAYKPGWRCLIIEDVVTTGSSILETAESLRQHGLVVEEAIVILDREQGGDQNLENHGIKMTSLLQVQPLLIALETEGLITSEQKSKVETFLSRTTSKFNLKLDNLFKKKLIPRMTCTASKKLLRIMYKKKTNLCLAADLQNWTEVLEVARTLGPHICLLRTHIDTYNLENYYQVVEFRKHLKDLATKFDFMIMEDRKFADIGSTVQRQLTSKPFEIAQWADMVTVHGLPGPGVLQCFEGLENIAVVVIAEMSSTGNLGRKVSDYKHECLKITDGYDKIVAGFVSHSKIRVDRKDTFFLQFTPGVALNDYTGGDGLGQQYVYVDDAILDRGADVIIVGRGILKHGNENWREVAEEFQRNGWSALVQKLMNKFRDT